MTFLSSRFLIVVENRVLVNQKTFLVEKRKSASLTITGIVSNANANRDTQGAHAVSFFCVVITYYKTRSDSGDSDFISFPLKWVLKTNYNQYIKN